MFFAYKMIPDKKFPRYQQKNLSYNQWGFVRRRGVMRTKKFVPQTWELITPNIAVGNAYVLQAIGEV